MEIERSPDLPPGRAQKGGESGPRSRPAAGGVDW